MRRRYDSFVTIKQLLVGVAAAGITVGLLVQRLPEKKLSKGVKIVKASRQASPAPAYRASSSGKVSKQARA